MPRDRCVSASVPERFARRRDELLESRRRSRRGPFVKSRLKLARQLMDTLSDEWDPKEFKDTYTDVLRQVIEVKVEGKEVVAPEMPKRERVTNLMEALLRRSLHRRSSPGGSPADCSGRPALAAGRPGSRVSATGYSDPLGDADVWPSPEGCRWFRAACCAASVSFTLRPPWASEKLRPWFVPVQTMSTAF
jgi:GAF domain-containing protein